MELLLLIRGSGQVLDRAHEVSHFEPQGTPRWFDKALCQIANDSHKAFTAVGLVRRDIERNPVGATPLVIVQDPLGAPLSSFQSLSDPYYRGPVSPGSLEKFSRLPPEHLFGTVATDLTEPWVHPGDRAAEIRHDHGAW